MGYLVTVDDSTSVYDALQKIRNDCDTSLALPFFNCRKGVCSSCLMQINGQQRLTCRTLVKDALAEDGSICIMPPKGRYVLKDLLTTGQGKQNGI